MSYLIVVALIAALVVLLLLATRRQAKVTASLPVEAQENDRQFYQESKKIVAATVAEQLAEKARDPRLASMTQSDLAWEVLKDCHDPEIPLNIVDLGLVLDVQVDDSAAVTVKLTMTSPACPSHVSISEDVKTKLSDAGFADPRVDVVWEPAWSPARISDEGKKRLGLS